jgi:hypothetical protein
MVKRRFPSVSHTKCLYNSRLIELVSIRWNLKSFSDPWETIPMNGTEKLAHVQENITHSIKSLILISCWMYFNMRFPTPRHSSNCYKENYLTSAIVWRKCDFQCELKALRDQFDDIWFKTEGYFSEAEVRESVVHKKRQRIHVGDKTMPCRCLLYEIVDTITRQLADRYVDFDQLEFLSLLDREKYGQYANNFPDSSFHSH